MKSKKCKAPTNCRHKPMYEISSYDKMDGEYRNNSDVCSLSVGKAQWSSTFEPSVKVWRNKNGRWSRQSEETTFTRAIDMAMIVLQVIKKYQLGKDFTNVNTVFDHLEIESAAYQSLYDKELERVIKDRYNEHLLPHIELLKTVLSEMK